MIRCGNHASRTKHSDKDQVKMCYQGAGVVSSELIVTPRETYTFSVVAFPDDEDDDGAAAAEMAYERYLEDRGSDEARLQDQVEAERGVISFSDAWDMACPERIAEREAEEAARDAGWSSAVSAVQDHRNSAREDLRREAYVAEAMDRLRRMVNHSRP